MKVAHCLEVLGAGLKSYGAATMGDAATLAQVVGDAARRIGWKGSQNQVAVGGETAELAVGVFDFVVVDYDVVEASAEACHDLGVGVVEGLCSHRIQKHQPCCCRSCLNCQTSVLTFYHLEIKSLF